MKNNLILNLLQFNSKILDAIHNLRIRIEQINKSDSTLKIKAIIPNLPEYSMDNFTITKGNTKIVSALSHKINNQDPNLKNESERNLQNVDITGTNEDFHMLEIGTLDSNASVSLEISYFSQLNQWNEISGLCTQLDIPYNLFTNYRSTMIDDQVVIGHTVGKHIYQNQVYQIEININADLMNKIINIQGKDKFNLEQINDQNANLTWNFSSKELSLQNSNYDMISQDNISLIFISELSLNQIIQQIHRYDKDYDKIKLTLENSATIQKYEQILEIKTIMPSNPIKQQTNSKEFIFIIDLADSIKSEQIEKAKQAVNLALHSLPINCSFNVISLGSFQTPINKNMMIYNQQNLEHSLDNIKSIKSQVQSVDLLPSIQQIMDFPLKDESTLRYVYIITKDDISNVNKLIDAVEDSSLKNTIISTICVGAEDNNDILNNRRASGKHEIIQNENMISSVLIKQLEMHKQNRQTELSLRINQNDPNQLSSIVKLHCNNKVLQEGDLGSFQAEIKEEIFNHISNNEVKDVDILSQSESIQSFSLNQSDITDSQMHHKIYQFFQDKSTTLEKSLKQYLLTKHTSFVAIEQNKSDEDDDKQVPCICFNIRNNATSEVDAKLDQMFSDFGGCCDSEEDYNDDYKNDESGEDDNVNHQHETPNMNNLYGLLNNDNYNPMNFDMINDQSIWNVPNQDKPIIEYNLDNNPVENKKETNDSDVIGDLENETNNISIKDQDEFIHIIDSINQDGSIDEEKSKLIIKKYLIDIDFLTQQQIVAANLVLIESKYEDRRNEWVLIQNKIMQYLKKQDQDQTQLKDGIKLIIN